MLNSIQLFLLLCLKAQALKEARRAARLMPPLDVLSLGAGVQSSTMILMADKGLILPRPAAAVFADTGNEPKAVYAWLDWLEKQVSIPIYRVSKSPGLTLGAASLNVRTSAKGNQYTKHAVPAFIVAPDGKVGMMMRQCTQDFKLEVIFREYKRLFLGRPLIQWIGISKDEADRMKPSRKKWITNRYPLVDMGMTRRQCLQWMTLNGYPEPPRSSCTFCPYHNASEWQRLKTEDPESFQEAVQYEKDLQVAVKKVPSMRGVPWLTDRLKPLDQVDFTVLPDQQLNLFRNECEGMCGN